MSFAEIIPVAEPEKKIEPADPYVSVKIKASLWRIVRTVASWRGVSSADLLTEFARDNAEKALEQVNRETRRKGGGH